MSDEQLSDLMTDLAPSMFVTRAAVDWHNERLRIERTTYSPEDREQAIRLIDDRLSTAVQIALSRKRGNSDVG